MTINRPLVLHLTAVAASWTLLFTWPNSVDAASLATSIVATSATWVTTRGYYREKLRALEGQLHWAESQAENWQKTAQNYQKAYRK